MTRTECYMALNSVRNVGSTKVRKLLEVFGNVENILAQSPETIAQIQGFSLETARKIVTWNESWSLEAELKKAEEMEITIIDCEDARYPSKLKTIYDPPLVLYVQGNIEALSKRSIAVVGSRHVTNYGFETARKLSFQLAYSGVCVTSGLARGIDTASHQGALAAHGTTVAVIGSSLDNLYPPENEVLAEKITQSGGACVSEFAFGTPPERYTFPMRNRIVSGMSDGVLVVEAGKDSGALITAQQAAEQGRLVFAVPGRIDSPHSKGCHTLIKEGAKLVDSIDDVFQELEMLFPRKEITSPALAPEHLTVEEKKVWETLESQEMHLDELIAKSGLNTGIVSASLLKLELKRLVKQLPGKYFVRVG